MTLCDPILQKDGVDELLSGSEAPSPATADRAPSRPLHGQLLFPAAVS